jgi:hypothetical protein
MAADALQGKQSTAPAFGNAIVLKLWTGARLFGNDFTQFGVAEFLDFFYLWLGYHRWLSFEPA